MFNICFKGAPFQRDGEEVLLGRLEGPGLNEDFWAPTSYWTKARYESQWRQSVKTALAGRPSALIVSIRDPRYANFVNLWLMYPMADQILLQNQMLALENLSPPLNEEDIGSSVRAYQSHNEDGEALSQWSIPRTLLADFLQQGNGCTQT
jgi:hypothetical protein